MKWKYFEQVFVLIQENTAYKLQKTITELDTLQML